MQAMQVLFSHLLHVFVFFTTSERKLNWNIRKTPTKTLTNTVNIPDGKILKTSYKRPDKKPGKRILHAAEAHSEPR